VKVPFHRYWFEQEEFEAVHEVLASGWLTSGSKVAAFEELFSVYKEVSYAVAVSSCTAGLQLILAALPLQPGDEIITTPLTFVCTANVILQRGCKVVFADVCADTLNISPRSIESVITARTKAIIVVHLAGNACALSGISAICEKYGLFLIEDCAHALETTFLGKPVGTFGVAGTFSFYPTKNITTGEGGMIITKDESLAKQFRLLRSHGVSTDSYKRSVGSFRQYDVVLSGYKCNMTDIEAAIGIKQLARAEYMWQKRAEIYQYYTAAFASNPFLTPISIEPNSKSGYHLYILRLKEQEIISRDELLDKLAALGVQCSVHFYPVHLFSYYQQIGYKVGLCPIAEKEAEWIFSLPLYPIMTQSEVEYVIESVLSVLEILK
jgi:dTDP-4-amino-4,6-dideoxygalactose transaminase